MSLSILFAQGLLDVMAANTAEPGQPAVKEPALAPKQQPLQAVENTVPTAAQQQSSSFFKAPKVRLAEVKGEPVGVKIDGALAWIETCKAEHCLVLRVACGGKVVLIAGTDGLRKRGGVSTQLMVCF